MTTQPPNDRRWLALYVLCAGVLMIVLDVTIVNVALPTIQDSLGFSQSDLTWVVNAYLVPFGGLLLLAGRLGDLLGQRKMFLVGLGIFVAASLLCAAAENQAMLIGGRFFAGVGGALSSAVVLGMIVTMFPEPREQAKAIGVYGFVASAGGSIGLLLGGALTEAISWHWIFIDQPADRHRHRLRRPAPGRGQARPRLQGGRRHSRRGPDHQLADDRRLRDPRRQRAWLGRRPDPDPRARSRSPSAPPSSPARRGSRTR